MDIKIEVILSISRQLMARNILHNARSVHQTVLQQNQMWQSKYCSPLKATHAERQALLKITDRRAQKQMYRLRCFGTYKKICLAFYPDKIPPV